MKQNQPSPDPSSLLDDITARVMRTAPWLMNPVTKALHGLSDTRKASRVAEVLDDVITGLEGFRSELSELYTNTPDFRGLMVEVLRASGGEPREEKRLLYAAFLTHSIISPLESAENQTRILNVLKQLTTDHVRILRTLTDLPARQTTYTKSPLQMLQAEVRDIPHDRMQGLLTQLTEMGITTITDWSSGACGNPEQLRKRFTAIGGRLMRIINN
jgi:hypothetical protein